jgi:hypothetical protein
MLARWRLFLTWMLMAALPLQGFAAGTMLLCGPATHEVAVVAAHQDAGHDHATHGHPSADGAKQGSASNQDAADDAQHQCNLCASCCHSVGITELSSVSRTAAPPAADLLDPIVPVASHLSRLPERPPRA